MSDCGCGPSQETVSRHVLWIAAGLNAAMFGAGLTFGLIAQSSGLIADALDMLGDTFAFGLALYVVRAAPVLRARLTKASGALLMLLGIGMWGSVVRRWLHGVEPDAVIMVAVATVSLGVNVTVMRLLSPHRHDNVSLSASWIFTRADVVANLGVIIAGILVAILHSLWPDLVIGVAIGGYVIHEGLGIWREAGRSVACEP